MCKPGPSQERWRAEFITLLRAHRIAERDAVIVDIVARVAPLAAAARQQAEDDVELDRLGQQVHTTVLATADLDDLRSRADSFLEAHATRWSTALMSPLEQEVTRGELRRLGGAYETRRSAELERAGAVHALPRRLDVSRAELYELARKAGIEGRSGMTRGQLIDELQRRSD
ncbi:MAG: hypothetical protein QOE19_1077 [Actinomycetota bacterium]|jgi:hypothetical protein|nr:hypothetical protein [Actinomycetota bacterium]